MTQFFNFFVNIWTTVINKISSYSFEFYGYQVNLFAILFVLFIVGFVITAFWRGSKA